LFFRQREGKKKMTVPDHNPALHESRREKKEGKREASSFQRRGREKKSVCQVLLSAVSNKARS